MTMEFNFKTEKLRDSLYSLDVDIDPSILDRLIAQDKWISFSAANREGFTDTINLRNWLSTVDMGSYELEFFNYVKSPEFKSKLLDVLKDDPGFKANWDNRIQFDKLDKITTIECSYHKDYPKFYTEFHLENRAQILFGMIYFIKDDTPDLSTYWYTDVNKSDMLRIPTGIGKGWICINTHRGWHEGSNNTTEDRYSFGFSLVMDLF